MGIVWDLVVEQQEAGGVGERERIIQALRQLQVQPVQLALLDLVLVAEVAVVLLLVMLVVALEQ